jgi:hypothetical protein
MRGMVHIWWKDVRQLWREIAVSVFLIVLYGWSLPRSWTSPELSSRAIGVSALAFSLVGGEFGSGWLAGFISLAWLFALVRAIQSDSLVGDRQFWVTRPYDWRQLLAAKFLFLLTLVNFPLLILDLYLLARAGFAPGQYLGGLLGMQLLLGGVLFLPAAALATITASVAQLLLALLAILVGKIATDFWSRDIVLSQFITIDPVPEICLIATFLTVIGLQFARRRTLVSRCLMAAGIFALVLMTLLAPYRRLVPRQYPRLEAAEQAHFQLSTGGSLGIWKTRSPTGIEKFGLSLPLALGRTGPDSFVILRGAQVDVEAPNGRKWEDAWSALHGQTLLPQDRNLSVNFQVPESFYPQSGQLPVTLRLTLALTYYQDANQRSFLVPAGTFVLPEGAQCRVAAPDETLPYLHHPLCLTPLHLPQSLFFKLRLKDSTCPDASATAAVSDNAIGYGWITSDPSARFGLSPVAEFLLEPSSWSSGPAPGGVSPPDLSQSSRHGICAGTVITMSNPQKVGDVTITQSFDHILLPDNRWLFRKAGSSARRKDEPVVRQVLALEKQLRRGDFLPCSAIKERSNHNCASAEER